ncbi:MAG: hypothetical protein RMJ19_11785 [Gemmatales bacterium]|nr:hypothetical protein [Gemmatales bacterium]MCS7161142.1 hypothetical protein [Gemmatales bacterium]MDW8176345.1 hypothetical protein [Gemmatales bacterium]MDW8222483.1 hypothetical protein [Gemmatales bacterium]
MTSDMTPPLTPKKWIKVALSLFVAWHFYGIFTAVTGQSTSMIHPAPLPALQLARTTYWYQHLLFMHNAYRFYVPDPGPVQTLWFRLQYEGQHGRRVAYWYEVPRREDFFWRMSYQRYMSVTMLVQMMGPDPTDQTKLHPTSETLLSSYVRHVAHKFPRHPEVPEAGPLQRIELYLVSRTTYPTGYDIQRGLTLDDPRWYRPVYYASYTSSGQRVQLETSLQVLRDHLPTILTNFRDTSEFFSALFPLTAEVLLYDFRFRIEAGADRQSALRQINPPEPMRQLLRIVPEALDLAETRPVSPATYTELINVLHQMCGARRGLRLLEDDLLPLGVRPRVMPPETLPGSKPSPGSVEPSSPTPPFLVPDPKNNVPKPNNAFGRPAVP